jgi:NAD(P)-dependent dehydrogenase (short-subunit alcohol dehydrogenase family)
LAEPEEVAQLALFLVSDANTYISGAVIPIDGAKTAGIMPVDRYRWGP